MKKLLIAFVVLGVLFGIGMSQAEAAKPISECPKGFVCNPFASNQYGVTAKVDGQPKLSLSYDSKQQEAVLRASINVTIKGGTVDTYIEQYVSVGLVNQSGEQNWYAQMSQQLVPKSNVQTVNGLYNKLYVIPAGKKASFEAIVLYNPKIMFAGTYSVIANGFVGYTDTNFMNGFKLGVDGKASKPVTIVGEVTPYIKGYSPGDLLAGQEVTLYGSRLNTGIVYIDDNIPVNQSKVAVDGSAITFTVPQLSPGTHYLYMQSAQGASNVIWFKITSLIWIEPSSTYIQGYEGELISANFSAYNAYGKGTGFDWQTEGMPSTINFSKTGPVTAQLFSSSTPGGKYTFKVIATSPDYPGEFGVSEVTVGIVGRVVCPVGYTCLPVAPTTPQPISCPSGYTCTSSNPVKPIVRQTMTVWDALKLFYSPLFK